MSIDIGPTGIIEADYPTIRSNIQSGDLLAWSSDNTTLSSRILTRVVRVLTASEYSHVGIALCEGGRVYVLEATIPCITLRPLSECEAFYHIPMRITWSDHLDWYLKHYIGKHYSLLDCAELCNNFYAQVPIELGDAYTPSHVVRSALANRYTSIMYIK
jgi:hypothetical protein